MIKDSHKNCIRIRVNKGCIILFYLGIKRTFTCIIYTHYMMNYIQQIKFGGHITNLNLKNIL